MTTEPHHQVSARLALSRAVDDLVRDAPARHKRCIGDAHWVVFERKYREDERVEFPQLFDVVLGTEELPVVSMGEAGTPTMATQLKDRFSMHRNSDPPRCLYSDCPEGHSLAKEGEERVTCATCRGDHPQPTTPTQRSNTLTVSAEHLRTSQPEPLWQTVGYALFLDAGVYSLYEYLPYIHGEETKYLLGQDPVREGTADDVLHDIDNVFASDTIEGLKKVLSRSPIEALLDIGAALTVEGHPEDVLWGQMLVAIEHGVSMEYIATMAKVLVQRGHRSKSSMARKVLAKLRPYVTPEGGQ